MRRWIVQAGLVLLWMAPCAAVAQDYPRYRAVGSTYVPLDSWTYSVFERLAAQGYVQTAMLGMKPWTRFECARLVDEATEILRARVLEDKGVEEHAAQAVEALEREFAYELDLLGGGPHRTARLESLYTRVTSISGPPLTDGLHFGQTISGDFGRPFRRGTNAIAGGSVRMEAGIFAAHIQAEYQHAPAAPALSDATLDLIAALDGKPRTPAAPFAAINRPALLDSYVAFNLRNWQVSIGRQSLSWGLGAGESLLMSNNAQPLDMVRATRVVPHRLPWVLKWLGPVRTEFFVSQLEGHTFAPRPYIYGSKISLKPHRRFELGYGKTTLIGGGNYPLDFRRLLKSFFGRQGQFTGDSRTALDFAWALPVSCECVSFYAELFQDDEPFFFTNPQKSVFRPGLYIARLPWLDRLDFRFEMAVSDAPSHENSDIGGGVLNYWNGDYHDGYVNRGFLLGNTVGRQGHTVQVQTNYWFAPDHVVGFEFKQQHVSERFVPQGGDWRDYGVRYQRRASNGLYIRGLFQFEQISRFPALFSGGRHNAVASLELGFWPGQRAQ